MAKVVSPEKIEILSNQLIIAAGNNDVAEIKRLQMCGADIDHKANITLGSGRVIIGENGLSQPESHTSALVVSLHNGAFDAALYLAQDGANATGERKNTNLLECEEEKPLDFLLNDHQREQAQETPQSITHLLQHAFDTKGERDQNYQTDLYTPEQRIQIFDALVANTKNPLDLVSKSTLDNALMWARSEMIPKLAEIGVKIEDRHFVKAADPIHRRDQAIPLMKAVLPYVENVNVRDASNQNAGHITAGNLDLTAFKWLEGQGLDKGAVANTNVPTYAHLVAGNLNIQNRTEETRATFAQHLAKNDYNIEHRGNPRLGCISPTDKAFDEGHINAGLVFLDAGVQKKSRYLADAISSRHFNKVTTESLVKFVDELSYRHSLTSETATKAYSAMLEKISWNDKNIPLYVPVAQALTQKGFQLNVSDYSGDEANAAQLLLTEMAKAPPPSVKTFTLPKTVKCQCLDHF